MQEGSPPTSEAPSAPEGTPPEQPAGTPEAVPSPERTAEEVEAIWKNRVAGKDRAHAAESQALRDQIADLNRQLGTKRQTEAAEMSDVERERARADAAEQRAAEVERQRVLDVRLIKYAAAGEMLDPAELASMDEGRLAALNARLTSDETPPSPPPVIDPNSARRPASTPPSAPQERSKEELVADLKRHEPAFKESLG